VLRRCVASPKDEVDRRLEVSYAGSGDCYAELGGTVDA